MKVNTPTLQARGAKPYSNRETGPEQTYHFGRPLASAEHVDHTEDQVEGQQANQGESQEAYDLTALRGQVLHGFSTRLILADRLQTYAIDNDLGIDESVRENLDRLKGRFMVGSAWPTAKDLTTLDTCIMELHERTRPVTISNLETRQQPLQKDKQFTSAILVLGGLGILATVGTFAATVNNIGPKLLAPSLLAMSLGLLGTLVYILFNVLDVNLPAILRDEDPRRNTARLLVGVLLGWVMYFAFAQKAFSSFGGPDPSTGAKVTILLPFLVGYSTALAVGILNNMIRAFELVFSVAGPSGGGVASAAQNGAGGAGSAHKRPAARKPRTKRPSSSPNP